MKELHLTDPTKIKAATTYNNAAEHFDDAPLAFWELYGHRTVGRLDLKRGSTVLDVGWTLRLYQPPNWLAQTEQFWGLISQRNCSNRRG